jgi:hypothetical protein
MITAWAITAVIALSVTWVLRRGRRGHRRERASVLVAIALFALFETWEAEYRLGMASAWKSACLRNAELLQQCQKARQQQFQSRNGASTSADLSLFEGSRFDLAPQPFRHPLSFGIFPVHAGHAVCRGGSAVSVGTAQVAPWCTGNTAHDWGSLHDSIRVALESPYRSWPKVGILVVPRFEFAPRNSG